MDNLFFNNSFGGSDSGLFSLLLIALFNPEILSAHPLPNIGMPLEEFDKLSTEEKSKIFEENLDEYGSKFMDKVKSNEFKNNEKLAKRLSRIENRINKLKARKQKIFDAGIME